MRSRGRWGFRPPLPRLGASKSLTQTVVRRADLLQDLQQVINLCRRVAGRHAQADATGAGGGRPGAGGAAGDAGGPPGGGGGGGGPARPPGGGEEGGGRGPAV